MTLPLSNVPLYSLDKLFPKVLLQSVGAPGLLINILKGVNLMTVSAPVVVFLYTSFAAASTMVSPGFPTTLTLKAVVISVPPKSLGRYVPITILLAPAISVISPGLDTVGNPGADPRLILTWYLPAPGAAV